MIMVSIIGGSGYTGGELLRLLMEHSEVSIAQVTSERFAGKSLSVVHPHLRGVDLKFCSVDQLEKCDLLFACLPHGELQKRFKEFSGLCERMIDLSADFRLRDPVNYENWYGEKHESTDVLSQFVYGNVELHREEMRKAKYVGGVGCNATASIFALYPLIKAGVVDANRPIVLEAKVGSSEAGNKPTEGSHHPERSGTVRSFAPTGHRHIGEVEQELGVGPVNLSVTAIEMVRGVMLTGHIWLKAPRNNQQEPKGIQGLNGIVQIPTSPSPSLAGGGQGVAQRFFLHGLTDKDIWKMYREAYGKEPFVRIVKERTGNFRYPDPKVLVGTNFCDVSWELDPRSNRIVVMSALDNLMKGASGMAVQAMNVMMGYPETMGLEFRGMHPL